MIEFRYHDGGRAAAGFQGDTDDCVTRAIAIATGRDYRQVYDDLWAQIRADDERPTVRAKRELRGQRRMKGPREGVHRRIYEPYLKERGWIWTPTMQIGSGCKVHLDRDELPDGRLIVRLSRHIATVVDGVLYDNHDSSREGTRCVYGYYQEGSS